MARWQASREKIRRMACAGGMTVFAVLCSGTGLGGEEARGVPRGMSRTYISPRPSAPGSACSANRNSKPPSDPAPLRPMAFGRAGSATTPQIHWNHLSKACKRQRVSERGRLYRCVLSTRGGVAEGQKPSASPCFGCRPGFSQARRCCSHGHFVHATSTEHNAHCDPARLSQALHRLTAPSSAFTVSACPKLRAHVLMLPRPVQTKRRLR
mmetsp:Transcript_47258/g.137549  ORF Transcript_47258/g.137549 Transcript_47258/m.137549 type:complete len:210 (+) Transcript_47258:415-1044(+)